MALKTSLTIITRRIAEAVKKASDAEGLTPGDYALAGTFDEKSDRISLRLGTDRSIDDRHWYGEILKEIRRSFPENPSIVRQIGLVIQKVQNLDEIYWDFSEAEDEIDLTEMLERAKSKSV